MAVAYDSTAAIFLKPRKSLSAFAAIKFLRDSAAAKGLKQTSHSAPFKGQQN